MSATATLTPAATARKAAPLPPVMTISPAAAARVQALLASRNAPAFGVRIGVKTKGCSGLSYTLEFADDRRPLEDLVEGHGVRILIDPKAALFIIGTEMDFVETDLESGFVFRNPNEKGRCGCGESFHV
jgi:iron-sulfur cluster assembly protein